MIDLEQQVKTANKNFYDIVGLSYEKIDKRRTRKLIHYVDDQVKRIAEYTNAESILDLGCGNGFISTIAESYFKRRYALDISFNIVRTIKDKKVLKITADSDSIPIKENKLCSVVTFALLHHCYSYHKMFVEIHRVLKKGGFYYSDHDMDSFFFKRFRPFLKLYRRIDNASRRYQAKFNEISENIYECCEFRNNGIPSQRIGAVLKEIGFKEVKIQYHWYGLSPLTDRLFGKRIYRWGYAPLVKIIAVK